MAIKQASGYDFVRASKNAQVAAPKKIDDIIQPFKWRGKCYPVSYLNTNVDQSLVVHSYPDKDGAHIENMGLKPIVVSARIPFNNFISPTKLETWKQGTLFPKAYNEFLSDCEDGSAGVLTHPFRGEMTVLCQKIDTPLDADTRGGVVVDVSWIETTEIDLTSKTSKTAAVQSTADQFYSELQTVYVFPNKNDFPDSNTFFGLIEQIVGYADTINLIGQQLLAPINALIFHLDRLLTAIRRANSNLLAGLRVTTVNLKTLIINIKQTLTGSAQTSLAVYTTKINCTMIDVSRQLGADLTSLLNLNPRLAKRTSLLRGTQVVYEK